MKPMETAATSSTDQRELKRRLAQILKGNPNKKCVDCHEKRPTWCSLIKPHSEAPVGSKMLAAFVCFQCAGIHRKLGTHICFVRSVSLDDWVKSEVEATERSGNEVVNNLYEGNWKRMMEENPAAEISRPAHGAHTGTRERFIRQKYEERMFYNKLAHYEHMADVKEALMSPPKTPKSPSVRKRLGAFFAQDKTLSNKLNGSKSVSLDETEKSTPSDNKSFFSVPVHFGDHKTKTKQRKQQQRLSESQSTSVDPVGGSMVRRGNRSSTSMTPRSGNSTVLTEPSWRDTEVELKGDDDHTNSNPNLNNTSHSKDSNNSSNSMLLRKPEAHSDPRRSAFQNSRSGSMNLSSSDLELSDGDLGGSDNMKRMAPSTPKKRPSLVSANHVSKPSPHHSRMNLYAQKPHRRDRSRSHSRSRDPVAETEKDPNRHRSRSSSRLRDGNHNHQSNSSLDHRREAHPHGSGRRGRSRSVKREKNIVAGAMRKQHRERSTSRTPSTSHVPETRRRESGTLQRTRSTSRMRRSKSADLDGLVRLSQGKRGPMRGTARAAPVQAPPERSQSDDLSGMVLILDDSSKDLMLDDDEELPRQQGRRGASRRARGRSTEGNGHSQEHPKRRSSRSRSRSRSHSRGRGSSRSLKNDRSPSRGQKDEAERPEHESPVRRGTRQGRASTRSLQNSSRSLHASPGRPRSRSRSHSRGRSSHDFGKEDDEEEIIEVEPRRGRRDSSNRSLSSERHSNKSIMSQHDMDGELETPSSSRSIASKIILEKKNSSRCVIGKRSKSAVVVHQERTAPGTPKVRAEKGHFRTPSTMSKSFKVEKVPVSATPKQDDVLTSPKNSGENDFQVIAAKPFALGGKGSNHSIGDPSQQCHKSFQRDVEKDRTMKDLRRCSRDRMANLKNERQARKAGIFASLDREEEEATAGAGPLVGGLRRGGGPQRSKSGTGTKLLIRSAAPKRSKSSDGLTMFKSKPSLDLGVELGKGSNNNALIKAWEERKQANQRYLEELESSVMG